VIRHVSVLTFDAGTDIAPIEQALATLPGHLTMRAYAFGRDLAVDDGNGSFAVVADFDTLDDYRAYRDDPEHRRIIAELIRPALASRAAVQYSV
jgi:hypothetical protein